MNRRDFIKWTILFGFFPEIILAKNNSIEEKLYPAYEEVKAKFGVEKEPILIVNGGEQKLYVVNEDYKFNIWRAYDISTSKLGFSNITGSFKTPTGIHRIADKYGHEFPLGTLFSGHNTGKVIKIDYFGTGKVDMTGRVMQLEGCEEKNMNTFSREVYIHGASSEGLIGTPASHGCIRMRNKEIIELYDMVNLGNYVNIKEKL